MRTGTPAVCVQLQEPRTVWVAFGALGYALVLHGMLYATFYELRKIMVSPTVCIQCLQQQRVGHGGLDGVHLGLVQQPILYTYDLRLRLRRYKRPQGALGPFRCTWDVPRPSHRVQEAGSRVASQSGSHALPGSGAPWAFRCNACWQSIYSHMPCCSW